MRSSPRAAAPGKSTSIHLDDEHDREGELWGIWQCAFEYRLQGYPPSWCWLWRRAA
jgi:hypothetical protein